MQAVWNNSSEIVHALLQRQDIDLSLKCKVLSLCPCMCSAYNANAVQTKGRTAYEYAYHGQKRIARAPNRPPPIQAIRHSTPTACVSLTDSTGLKIAAAIRQRAQQSIPSQPDTTHEIPSQPDATHEIPSQPDTTHEEAQVKPTRKAKAQAMTKAKRKHSEEVAAQHDCNF